MHSHVLLPLVGAVDEHAKQSRAHANHLEASHNSLEFFDDSFRIMFIQNEHQCLDLHVLRPLLCRRCVRVRVRVTFHSGNAKKYEREGWGRYRNPQTGSHGDTMKSSR